MRELDFKAPVLSVVATMVLLLGTYIQEGQAQPPPVGAPTVREGAFAMMLAEALSIGHPSSEAEAESMLGTAGIAPRNGWIADYPVTPDILGELRDSVTYAAQARTIPIDEATALKTLEDVQASANMSLSPGPAGPPGNVLRRRDRQRTSRQQLSRPDSHQQLLLRAGTSYRDILCSAAGLLLFVCLGSLSVLVGWILVWGIFHAPRFSQAFQ